MELDGVGGRCSLATCRSIDYLPFRCEYCGNQFCQTHYLPDAHACAYAQHTSHAENRDVLTCPLCSQPVPAPLGVDRGTALVRHVDNGCPVEQKSRAARQCAKQGCTKRDIAQIKCRACSRVYCLEHRLETDHDCVALKLKNTLPPPTSAAARKPTGMLAKMRPNRTSNQEPSNQAPKTHNAQPPTSSTTPSSSKKRSSSASRRSRRFTSTTTHPQSSTSSPSPLPLTKFVNTPTTPTQGKNVPAPSTIGESDREIGRLLLAVFFSANMQRAPEYRVVNSRHSAGRILDDLKLPPITNSEASRYGLYAVKPGFGGVNLLPRITPLRDIDEATLPNGAIVVVEEGENGLPQHWATVLASAAPTSIRRSSSKKSTSKCIVM